jgi:hypothetical protein
MFDLWLALFASIRGSHGLLGFAWMAFFSNACILTNVNCKYYSFFF